MTDTVKRRGRTLEERRRVIDMLAGITWWNLRDTAVYLDKGPRFLLNEIHKGRLKAARCGGRGEILCCQEWADAWVNSHAAMVIVEPIWRRA